MSRGGYAGHGGIGEALGVSLLSVTWVLTTLYLCRFLYIIFMATRQGTTGGVMAIDHVSRRSSRVGMWRIGVTRAHTLLCVLAVALVVLMGVTAVGVGVGWGHTAVLGAVG